MGWSCAAVAGRVMEAWSAACVASTGSSNMYVTSRGKYFWELSRREYDDGAVTGTIMKVVSEDGDRVLAKPAGSFRINGDGTVARAPAFLKKASKDVRAVEPYVSGVREGYLYL